MKFIIVPTNPPPVSEAEENAILDLFDQIADTKGYNKKQIRLAQDDPKDQKKAKEQLRFVAEKHNFRITFSRNPFAANVSSKRPTDNKLSTYREDADKVKEHVLMHKEESFTRKALKQRTGVGLSVISKLLKSWNRQGYINGELTHKDATFTLTTLGASELSKATR